MTRKTRLTLFTIFLLLSSGSCQRRISIDQEFTLYTKEGLVAPNVLVITYIQGRDSPWWEEPVVSGDTRSIEERTEATTFVTMTDSRGKFKIKGTGVYLGIVTVFETSVYSLYSSRITQNTEISRKLFIDQTRYFCPLSIYSMEGIANNTLVVDLFAALNKTHCEFSGVVEDESGVALRNVPYELRRHNDGTLVEQYVTDSYGGIKTFIPIGVNVDVFLKPAARNWPGQSSRRPEFMPPGLTDLWVGDVDGCQQAVGLQAVELEAN